MVKRNRKSSISTNTIVIGFLSLIIILLIGIGGYFYFTGDSDFKSISSNTEEILKTETDMTPFDNNDNEILTNLLDDQEPVKQEGYVPIPLITGTIDVPLSDFDIKTQGYLYIYNNMQNVEMTLKINNEEFSLPFSSVVDQGTYNIEITTSNPYYQTYRESIIITPLTLKQRGIILNSIPQTKQDTDSSSDYYSDVEDTTTYDYEDVPVPNSNDPTYSNNDPTYSNNEPTPSYNPTPDKSNINQKEPTATGDLYISAGAHYKANIYLDGKLIATGKNIQISNLAVGEHSLKWTDDGYKDYYTKIVVEKDKKTTAYPVWTLVSVPQSANKPDGYKFTSVNIETNYEDAFNHKHWAVANADIIYKSTDGNRLWCDGKYYTTISDKTGNSGRGIKNVYAKDGSQIEITVKHKDIFKRIVTIKPSGNYATIPVLTITNLAEIKCTYNLLDSSTNKQQYVPVINNFYMYETGSDFIRRANLLDFASFYKTSNADVYYAYGTTYNRDSMKWSKLDSISSGTKSSKILKNHAYLPLDYETNGKLNIYILIRYKDDSKSNMDVYKFKIAHNTGYNNNDKSLYWERSVVDYIPESESSKWSF